MAVIRQIYENLPKTIKAPIFLKNRRVEVIMLPSADKFKKPKSRRKNPIEEIIGAWETAV